MDKSKGEGVYEEFTQKLIKEGRGKTKWEKPGFTEEMQREETDRREIVRRAVHSVALKDSQVDHYAETLIAALMGAVGETWKERVDDALHNFEISVEEKLVEARVREDETGRKDEFKKMSDARAVSKNIKEKLIAKLDELQERSEASEEIRELREEMSKKKAKAA
ncbi:hypothetical protein KKD80_02015 [Patescibacteria group bacterium]|nr:hypothetical protein [Patescibacteria group bacterium]